MRHRGGDPPREGLDERKAGGNSLALIGFEWLTHAGLSFVAGCPLQRRFGALNGACVRDP